MIIKPDGKRWRPIGTYFSVGYKKMLRIYSRALTSLLKVLGIDDIILHNTQDLKQKVSDFNQKARGLGYKISLMGFDVKDFFADINKTVLLFRVKFMLDYYKNQYHTSFISIPKYGKNVPPIPGWTSDSAYYTIHLTLLLEVIIFATTNALFILGCHVLLQILGLPMG